MVDTEGEKEEQIREEKLHFAIPGSERVFCPSQRPDRLWDPPNFLYIGQGGLLSRGNVAGA
jgi:hypothetical protein